MDNKNPVYSHNPYDRGSFPLLVLKVNHRTCTPPNEGFRILHWHDEVQFLYLIKGTVDAQVHQDHLLIHAGECLFINRNAVHLIQGSDSCIYRSYIIPEKMLGFFPGSVMEEQYVFPITHNPCFTHCLLTPQHEPHVPVLQNLKKLDETYTASAPNPFFEYDLSIQIAVLWKAFLSCLPKLPPKTDLFLRDLDRIQKLLTYIHQNYGKDLSLAAIADAAHISKSECQRTFLKFTHTSPYQYLLRYRLHAAASQLKSSSRTVSSIASDTGFSSVSSFIHYFKKQYGMTPTAYRTSETSLL